MKNSSVADPPKGPGITSETDMTPYFSGQRLYGDDFTLEQLRAWYSKEEEGYSSTGHASDKEKYKYEYHALNKWVLFRHLPDRIFEKTLGFGSAYGDEFLPILHKLNKITILEPSSLLTKPDLNGVPLTYVKPTIDGKMVFADGEFDLIVSSAALHHAANISNIVREFYRCLKPGGYALIREPIVTQGDWRRPRKGLSPCERGIPLDLFDQIVTAPGFEIMRRTRFDFPLTKGLKRFADWPIFNYTLIVLFDQLFSTLFQWKATYHPTTVWQKIQPASVAYVLRKPL